MPLDLPALLAGKRAERAATFPDFVDGADVDRPCILVPLTGTEDAEVLSFAASYARDKGATEAKPGDPLYDLGFMAKAVALGVRHPDSRAPFFASAAAVLDELPRETLVYLFAMVEDWQDSCSPSVRKATQDDLLVGVTALALGGTEAERFFDRLSPGMRRTYALFMARRLFDSLAPKSPTTSPPTATTTRSLRPLAHAKRRAPTP